MITLKNLDPPLYHTSTPSLLDTRRQIKFTFPRKKREGLNYGFTSWEVPPPSLPPSIWQIVLKCTQTSESVISQLWRTQTKSYGLDELGITPEFTVYVRVS